MSNPAIPASFTVDVIPGVLAAGGTALDLVGLMLTNGIKPPIATVQSFASTTDVEDYFGSTSPEAAAAAIYFAGYTIGTALPGKLWFAQYPTAPVSAYLEGGALTVPLSQLVSGSSGTFTIAIDGTPITTSSISFASATSFSQCGALISRALAITAGSCTGSIAGTVMTVSAVASGTVVKAGDVISGTNVTAGTVILSQLTGSTGSTGTYSVSISQSVTSTTIALYAGVCTYDAIADAFVITSTTAGPSSSVGFATAPTNVCVSLRFTAASGATQSPGSAVGVPGPFMTSVVAQTTNWACFDTLFEPITSDKILFATWTSQQLNRYLYAAWDSITAIAAASSTDTTSFGYQIKQLGLSGTAPIYIDPNDAHFLMGFVASLNFTETNGRATADFRSSPAGLTPTVTDETTAQNLTTNGYNYYGVNATAADEFIYFAPGQLSGEFKWIDDYVDQIWMNNQFQLDLMVLLTNIKSIPYNQAGYATISAALQTTIQQALNFGVIRTGVVLSSTQITIVNGQAGANIAPLIQTQGWYLAVKDPGPTVRAARGSPNITFWYTGGGSVQTIDLSSILVQ